MPAAQRGDHEGTVGPESGALGVVKGHRDEANEAIAKREEGRDLQDRVEAEAACTACSASHASRPTPSETAGPAPR